MGHLAPMWLAGDIFVGFRRFRRELGFKFLYFNTGCEGQQLNRQRKRSQGKGRGRGGGAEQLQREAGAAAAVR